MTTIHDDRDDRKRNEPDANRDPISGEPGAHPIGTGIGAASGGVAAGAATGAVLGTTVGPVGTMVGAGIGAAVGAIAGGLAGKAVAEKVNPTVEHGFWRENYRSRSYVEPNDPYERYSAAYEYGWISRAANEDRAFDDVEPTLRDSWGRTPAASNLPWDRARGAVKDSWDRVSAQPNTVNRPLR